MSSLPLLKAYDKFYRSFYMTRLTVAWLITLVLVSTSQADLVGHWTGDGNFSDSSGSHHDGTAFGNAGFSTGVFGQAFEFDGSGDYITVAHHNQFNFGTGDFSVTFRVNFDSIPTNGAGLVDKDSHDDPSRASFEGWLFNSFDGGGGVGWETRDIPGTQTHNRHARANFNVSTWYNITSTRQSNVLRLYVDGILQQTNTESSPTNVNNSSDLIFGALDPSAQFFDGRIDDIAIFNNALSQGNVISIFDGGVSAVPEPSTASTFGLLFLLGLRRNRIRVRNFQ